MCRWRSLCSASTADTVTPCTRRSRAWTTRFVFLSLSIKFRGMSLHEPSLLLLTSGWGGPRVAGPAGCRGLPVGCLLRRTPCRRLLPNVGPRRSPAAVQLHAAVSARYLLLCSPAASPFSSLPLLQVQNEGTCGEFARTFFQPIKKQTPRKK